MTKISVYFFALLLLISCQKKDGLSQFDWMTGEWVNNDDPLAESSETWWIVSENEMNGIGLTIEGSDTIFSETLRIIKKGNDVLYIADVGEGSVEFKLTTAEDHTWQFENPDHDFPQRIIYSSKGDSMTVYTEAGDVSIPFTFKRKK